MTRPPAPIVALALACALSSTTSAYLKFGATAGNRTITLKWDRFPIRYFVADGGVPGVSPDQLRTTLDRAFGTWRDVPSSSITYEFAGFTGGRPFDDDGVSVLGFDDRPEMERVLGATGFVIDTVTGEIVESDIFFNSTFRWSVAESGEPGRFDLQSVALHEIGHLSGLGHSALGETELRPGGGRRVIAAEAVMFPIAFASGTTAERTLRADDVAGISDLYPDGRFRQETGSVHGHVMKSGRGVFGAHVVAFNLETGKLVSNFTLNDRGEFGIAGLDPGPHAIRVEPIDDADVESFFDGPPMADVDFRVTFHDRIAVVPRGGTAPEVEITVLPR